MEVASSIRLDSSGFFIDTLYLEAPSQSFLKFTRNHNTVLKKIDNITYSWTSSCVLVLKIFNIELASEYVEISGNYSLDYKTRNEYTLINSVEDVIFNSEFDMVEYFWQAHFLLIFISMIVLFIRKTPLNMRHGLIVVIPLFGPGVYLTKEMIRFYQARKKKESKRISQSTQHQQNASY